MGVQDVTPHREQASGLGAQSHVLPRPAPRGSRPVARGAGRRSRWSRTGGGGSGTVTGWVQPAARSAASAHAATRRWCEFPAMGRPILVPTHQDEAGFRRRRGWMASRGSAWFDRGMPKEPLEGTPEAEEDPGGAPGVSSASGGGVRRALLAPLANQDRALVLDLARRLAHPATDPGAFGDPTPPRRAPPAGFWLQEALAHAAAAQPCPPLDARFRADVCIVGGGFAGLVDRRGALRARSWDAHRPAGAGHLRRRRQRPQPGSCSGCGDSRDDRSVR